jgi:hypothetical protein
MNDHDTIVSAPSGWTIATFVAGDVRYLAIIAFRISPGGTLQQAITAEGYRLKFSALCDPASGRFIAVTDGKMYRDEAAFIAAMKFLSEAPEVSSETVAH